MGSISEWYICDVEDVTKVKLFHRGKIHRPPEHRKGWSFTTDSGCFRSSGRLRIEAESLHRVTPVRMVQLDVPVTKLSVESA